MAGETAAKIEFLTTTKIPLRNGNVLHVSELDTAFNIIAKESSQDGADLFNLVTKVVLLEEVEHDLCNESAIGFKLFTVFKKEGIQTGKENLWSPIKKQKLLTWKTTRKKFKVTVDNKVVELQEDSCPFARMMMVCKSRPEINIA